MSIFYGMTVDIFSGENSEIGEWVTQLSHYLDANMSDYRIVCDETNNTEETLANNELNVDLFVRPVTYEPWILLSFTVESQAPPSIDYLAITRAVSVGNKTNQENLE